MVSKRFIKEVGGLIPELTSVDGYFYVKPVDHILSGFVCEQMSKKAYIWQFSYPLYHYSKSAVLTFGDRIDGPSRIIKFDAIPKKDLAKEFCSRISGLLDNCYDRLTLTSLLSLIDNNGMLGNPTVRRSYALTLILLRRFNEAKQQLEMVIEGEPVGSGYDRFIQHTVEIYDALNIDSKRARDMVLSISAEKKRLLGIES